MCHLKFRERRSRAKGKGKEDEENRKYLQGDRKIKVEEQKGQDTVVNLVVNLSDPTE